MGLAHNDAKDDRQTTSRLASQLSAAQSAATASEFADLALVIERWQGLPAKVKARIAALVRNANAKAKFPTATKTVQLVSNALTVAPIAGQIIGEHVTNLEERSSRNRVEKADLR